MRAKKLTYNAMFIALTFIATYIVKIPTPGTGYIHLGDCVALLAGAFLGPIAGALSAGVGMALADLAGGYALWAAGTFIVKFLMTFVFSVIIHKAIEDKSQTKKYTSIIIFAGLISEAIMIAGYFAYNILIVLIVSGEFNAAALSAAVAASIADIPFNILQGAIAIAITIPILGRLSKKKHNF